MRRFSLVPHSSSIGLFVCFPSSRHKKTLNGMKIEKEYVRRKIKVILDAGELK